MARIDEPDEPQELSANFIPLTEQRKLLMELVQLQQEMILDYQRSGGIIAFDPLNIKSRMERIQGSVLRDDDDDFDYNIDDNGDTPRIPSPEELLNQFSGQVPDAFTPFDFATLANMDDEAALRILLQENERLAAYLPRSALNSSEYTHNTSGTAISVLLEIIAKIIRVYERAEESSTNK